MSRVTRRALLMSALAFAVAASTAPRWSAQVDAIVQTASPQLVDLSDLNDFRARFNADSDFTRLVLLVSPT